MWEVLLKSNKKLFELEDNDFDKNLQDVYQPQDHNNTSKTSDIDEGDN